MPTDRGKFREPAGTPRWKPTTTPLTHQVTALHPLHHSSRSRWAGGREIKRLGDPAWTLGGGELWPPAHNSSNLTYTTRRQARHLTTLNDPRKHPIWPPNPSSPPPSSQPTLPSSAMSAPALWSRAPTGCMSTSCKCPSSPSLTSGDLGSARELVAHISIKGRPFRTQHHLWRPRRRQDPQTCRPACRELREGHL